MKSRAEQMAERYQAKLVLGAGDRSLIRPIPAQVTNYRFAMERQNHLTSQVKALLGTAGVSTIMYTSYHAFAREVDRLSRADITRHSLICEVQIAISKWVSRGLVLSVLQDIRMQVFNIPAPTAP